MAGAIALLVVAGGGAWLLARGDDPSGTRTTPTAASPGTTDFSARFARYEPAREPNGDAAKVEWPSYVRAAGPEVRRLYEYQIENGDLMRYMPCFCGCIWEAGHRSNRDCYVKRVGRDGNVVLDSMAPT